MELPRAGWYMSVIDPCQERTCCEEPNMVPYDKPFLMIDRQGEWEVYSYAPIGEAEKVAFLKECITFLNHRIMTDGK